MCYPEPPVPLEDFPRELDMSRRGAGANAPLAEAVKKAVSIPVITVGRLDPDLGEKILREGKADFIAMTRRLFADPELPNKLAAGRFDDISALHFLYTMQGRGWAETLQDQCRPGHGTKLRTDTGRKEEAGSGRRRRPGRSRGSTGGGIERARGNALRKIV